MSDVKLAEHEEMHRWKRLPTWAQQELEQWRRDEAHQRARAESAQARIERLRAALRAVELSFDSLPTVRLGARAALEEDDRAR
jgi:hypothetical protein